MVVPPGGCWRCASTSTSGAQGARVLRCAHAQAIGTQSVAQLDSAAPAEVILESHYQGFHLAHEHTPVMPVDGPVASSKDTQPPEARTEAYGIYNSERDTSPPSHSTKIR